MGLIQNMEKFNESKSNKSQLYINLGVDYIEDWYEIHDMSPKQKIEEDYNHF